MIHTSPRLLCKNQPALTEVKILRDTVPQNKMTLGQSDTHTEVTFSHGQIGLHYSLRRDSKLSVALKQSPQN